MPAAFATFAHFAASSLMKAAYSAGPSPAGSTPVASSCLRVAGSRSGGESAAWTRSMTGLGVPAGARMPFQL